MQSFIYNTASNYDRKFYYFKIVRLFYVKSSLLKLTNCIVLLLTIQFHKYYFYNIIF